MNCIDAKENITIDLQIAWFIILMEILYIDEIYGNNGISNDLIVSNW